MARRVSAVIGSVLIVVFLLFSSNVLTEVPCGRTPSDVFKSTFIHTDPVHLMENMYFLYAMSAVEERMGSKPFTWLVLWLFAFCALGEWLVKDMIQSSKCSVGFSGVLFGMITWDMASNNGVDKGLIAAAAIQVASASKYGDNRDNVGHAIGAVAGILGGMLWAQIPS